MQMILSRRLISLLTILILLLPRLNGANPLSTAGTGIVDTTCNDQVINNGKLWINKFASAENSQFLFTDKFLFSSINILGKRYEGFSIKYDIYADELITISCDGSLIQLNREMVDSFSFNFEGKVYKFTNLSCDSIAGLKGFVNMLYSGKSKLCIKNIKELYHMDGQTVNPKFFQKNRVYLVLENRAWPLKGKKSLLQVMCDKENELKEFISVNRIKVSKYDPETCIPVIRFYDSLKK